MPTNLAPLKKPAIILASLAGLAVGTTAFALIALPWIVSSSTVRQTVEETLTKSLNRPVSVGRLAFSWGGGLSVGEIAIAEDTSFGGGKLLTVDGVAFDLSYKSLLDKTIEAGLSVTGPKLNIVRNKEGRTNLEALAEGMPKAQPPPTPPDTGPQTLPKADVTLNVADILVSATDLKEGKTASFHNAGFHASLDTSAEVPLKVRLGGTLSLDGKTPGELLLEVALSNFFDSSRVVTPLAAAGEVKARLPGVVADGRASGSAAQFSASVEPGQLLDALRPFLPSDLATLKAQGKIDLTAKAQIPQKDVAEFDAAVSLTGFGASGGRLPKPVAIEAGRLFAKGTRKGDAVNVSEGGLALPGVSAGFAADYVKPSAEGETLAARIRNLHIDFAKLMELAGPFVPTGESYAFSGAQNSLDIAKIDADLLLAKGDGKVTLEALALSLSSLDAKKPGQKLKLQGLKLACPKVAATLAGNQPREVNAAVDVSLAKFMREGEGPLSVEGLKVQNLLVAAKDISLDKAAPFGARLSAKASGKVALDGAQEGNKVGVEKLAADFALNADISDIARATIPKFSLDIAKLRLLGKDGEATTVGGLGLTLADANVSAKPEGKDAAATLASLKLSLASASKKSPKEDFALSGLDLALEDLEAKNGEKLDLALALRATLGEARAQKPKPMKLTGVKFGLERLELARFAPNDKISTGYEGRVKIAQTFAAQTLELDGAHKAQALEQALKADVELGAVTKALVESFSFKAKAASTNAAGQSYSLASPAFSLLGLAFEGAPDASSGEVRFASANFDAQSITGAGKDADLSASGFAMSAANMTATLASGLPKNLRLALDAKLSELSAQSPKKASMKGFALALGELKLWDFSKAPQTPVGYAGGFAADVKLGADGLDLDGTARVTVLSQAIKAQGTLGATPDVALKEFHLSAASVKQAGEGQSALGPQPTLGPLDVKLALNALVKSLDPQAVDVSGLSLAASLADAASLTLEADARESGRQSLSAKGRATLDLEKLRGLMPPDAAAKLHGGRAKADFAFEGRIPPDDDIARIKELASAQKPDLKGLLNETGFARLLTIDLDLQDIQADVDTSEGPARVLVSTNTPLTLKIAEGFSSVELNADLSANPGRLVKALGDEPVLADFKLSLALKDLDHLAVRQSLKTTGGVKASQKLDLSLDRLAKAAKLEGNPTPRQLMNTLDARVAFAADLDAPKTMTLPGGKEFSGGAQVAFQADLASEKSLGVALSASFAKADLTLGPDMALKNLNGSVDFKKSYLLNAPQTPPGAKSAIMEGDYLSQAVLRGDAQAPPPARDMASLEAISTSKPTLWADSISLAGPAGPLAVNTFRAWLSFNKGLPSVDGFSLETLGGSVKGSAILSRLGDEVATTINVGFSDLDMAKLLDAKEQKALGSDTLLSGGMYLDMVLSEVWSELLSSMSMDMRLTKIGSKALDRALYSLDPNGNDPSVTEQRQMLETGNVNWIWAHLKNGRFSLAGSLSAKGIDIDMPKIDRVPLGQYGSFPKGRDFAQGLAPKIELLKNLSSPTLVFLDDGQPALLKGQTETP